MASSPILVPVSGALGEAVSQRVSRANWLRLIVCILVLPQVSTALWWLQTRSLMHLRGVVNVEYCVLLAVALLFPRWWTVALAAGELILSLVEPLAHVYYFSPGDGVRALRYLHLVPVDLLIAYSGVLVVYAAGAAMVVRSTAKSLPRSWASTTAVALITCSVAFVACDTAAGRLRPIGVPNHVRDPDLRRLRVAREPIASLVYASTLCQASCAPHGTSLFNMDSALAHALREIRPAAQPNVVLVLTESWGLATDPKLAYQELEPYRSAAVQERYRVEAGSVPFYGSTTSGETRELCGDSLGRWGDGGSAAQYGSCWPEQFDRRGYATLAVHGFTPTMYERESWYRDLGFSQAMFLPQLQRSGAALCNGAFPGACDTDVAKWIGGFLDRGRGGKPAFVHWVTLNSHLPVAAEQGAVAKEDCRRAEIAPDASLCAWFDRIEDVHRSVAELASRQELAPTVFVIVGDHAPPFWNRQVRNEFSQTEVPWVILMPRSSESAAPDHLLSAAARPVPHRLPGVAGTARASHDQRRAAKHLPPATPKAAG